MVQAIEKRVLKLTKGDPQGTVTHEEITKIVGKRKNKKVYATDHYGSLYDFRYLGPGWNIIANDSPGGNNLDVRFVEFPLKGGGFTHDRVDAEYWT